ncbi:hypothetical protein [Pseudoalteromonas sp. RB2-MNA-CIBAN-0110]|uniref:hypothetical protein n=1 Tax=Pseudoalteromonas sp. RB2-MNA-CIBAN-0110 TaxID=3140439 RepID=UPI003319616D
MFEDLNSSQKERLVRLEQRINPLSYNKFIEILNLDINDILVRFEGAADKHVRAEEDNITNEIAGNLLSLGYDEVSEQTKKNGAVDLSVKSSGFSWIAEAKLDYSCNKVFEGLLQLITRYVKRDKKAGFLIYCQRPGAIIFFNQFQNYLTEQKWKNSKTINKDIVNLQKIINCFSDIKISKVEEQNFQLTVKKPSGAEIDIQCYCLDIAHDPVDSSGRNAKKHRVGNAKIVLERVFIQWKESGFEELDHIQLKNNLGRYLGIDD